MEKTLLFETMPISGFDYKFDKAVVSESLKHKGRLKLKLPVGILNIPTGNKRIYEESEVVKSFSDMANIFESGGVHGQHGEHPDSFSVKPDKVSHIITKAWVEEHNNTKYIWNEWIVLSKGAGEHLTEMILSGARFGVSIRGRGVEVTEGENKFIRQYEYGGTDTVENPSTGIYAGRSIPQIEVSLTESLDEAICKCKNLLAENNILDDSENNKTAGHQETKTEEIMEKLKHWAIVFDEGIIRDGLVLNRLRAELEQEGMMPNFSYLRLGYPIIVVWAKSESDIKGAYSAFVDKSLIERIIKIIPLDEYEVELAKPAQESKAKDDLLKAKEKALKEAMQKINHLETMNKELSKQVREFSEKQVQESVKNVEAYQQIRKLETKLEGLTAKCKILESKSEEGLEVYQIAEALRGYAYDLQSELDLLTKIAESLRQHYTDMEVRAIDFAESYEISTQLLDEMRAQFKTTTNSALHNDIGFYLRKYPYLMVLKEELSQSRTVDELRGRVLKYVKLLSGTTQKEIAIEGRTVRNVNVI